MVMVSLPFVANSGMCRTTGSSSSSAPRSHCSATETATLGLVIDHQTTIESGVIGVPARASPTPMSATGVPSIDHVDQRSGVQAALDAVDEDVHRAGNGRGAGARDRVSAHGWGR